MPSQTSPLAHAQGISQAQDCCNPKKPKMGHHGWSSKARAKLRAAALPQRLSPTPPSSRGTDPRAVTGIWIAGHHVLMTQSQEQLKTTALK